LSELRPIRLLPKFLWVGSAHTRADASAHAATRTRAHTRADASAHAATHARAHTRADASAHAATHARGGTVRDRPDQLRLLRLPRPDLLRHVPGLRPGWLLPKLLRVGPDANTGAYACASHSANAAAHARGGPMRHGPSQLCVLRVPRPEFLSQLSELRPGWLLQKFLWVGGRQATRQPVKVNHGLYVYRIPSRSLLVPTQTVRSGLRLSAEILHRQLDRNVALLLTRASVSKLGVVSL